MKVAFSESFKRVLKKKIKNNVLPEQKFWNRTQLFINNPFNHQLKTHKLSGKLKDLWSFSIEYDLRVVFYFEEEQEKAVFINFGTHDEVY